ncbi:hypothetical protein [uncultured Sphingomonas sp.]|uniref:hypothetical protein n=1 Tax=uncultured Sphingomonas sp. TaxID=158754 RepID=UPI0030F6AE11
MSGAQHSPRTILAKAYRDNGDIGAANYIEAGHDLQPDTQVHLLAIRDALALSTTPSQGLDAATVDERTVVNDVLATLRQYIDDMRYPPDSDSRPRRIAAAEHVIRKLLGDAS